jgi:hypothetical protein
MQIGQIRQEIIADKHAKQDEIVDDLFEVVCEWQRLCESAEFEVEIFAKQAEMEQEEIGVFQTKDWPVSSV